MFKLTRSGTSLSVKELRWMEFERKVLAFEALMENN
jgi:hypothetical protein